VGWVWWGRDARSSLAVSNVSFFGLLVCVGRDGGGFEMFEIFVGGKVHNGGTGMLSVEGKLRLNSLGAGKRFVSYLYPSPHFLLWRKACYPFLNLLSSHSCAVFL
jgi:hypothetical protein